VVRRDAAMSRMEDLDAPKSTKKSSPATSASIVTAAERSQQTADDPKTNKADAGSKQSRVIAMLQSPTGATIAALMKATTGWQPHSVRGFLAGVVRKRLKLELASKTIAGTRFYQITRAADGSRQSRRRSA
jgi:Protein of unknown function (DUF3489)